MSPRRRRPLAWLAARRATRAQMPTRAARIAAEAATGALGPLTHGMRRAAVYVALGVAVGVIAGAALVALARSGAPAG